MSDRGHYLNFSSDSDQIRFSLYFGFLYCLNCYLKIEMMCQIRLRLELDLLENQHKIKITQGFLLMGEIGIKLIVISFCNISLYWKSNQV